MLKQILFVVAVNGLASSSLYASERCDRSFLQQYHDAARVVDSLRPDKGGQMRVYATDGSEFTAGQVRWMRGQLRLVDEACLRSDQAAAIRVLNGVQQLVQTHRRGS